MKPLIRRNWSGRNQSLIPPAGLISFLFAACFALRRGTGRCAESARVLKLPRRTRSDVVNIGLWSAAVSLVLVSGLTSVVQAQTSPSVVVWGDNTYLQTNVPPALTDAIAIAAGRNHCLALNSDGTVVAWGDTRYGNTFVPPGLSNVIAIAAGEVHSLALKSDGIVVAWGDQGRANTNVPPDLTNVIAIAGGGLQSLALKANGTVVAWGDNRWGQTRVPPGLSNVVAVAAGEYQSLALQSNGTVVAWGLNDCGQTNVPAGLSNVIAIASGWKYNLALKSDGTVVAWGDNYAGQTSVPIGLSNIIAIAAGMGHNLLLKSDGTVVAWGDNLYGQCNVPTAAAGAIAIAAKVDDSMALTGRAVIRSQPLSQTSGLGSTVQFQVQAESRVPLAYQWFFNTTNLLLNATNTVLQLTNVQPSQSGAYTAVISNRFASVTSAPAMLVVATAPVMVGFPASQKAFAGDTINFSVVAVGGLPLAYQWYFGTNTILRATNSSIYVTNVQPRQLGNYTVVIANVYGAVTSAPAMLEFYPTVTMTNGTEADLRAAMADGGTVIFACDGMISLGDAITISANTVLDATGRQITINSGGGRRVFVMGTNCTLTLNHLTIQGGGILNAGGTANLNGVIFYGNSASNGGAIYNAGQMNVKSCCFTNNGASFGGAIYNAGSINLDLCQMGGNSARGAGGVLPPPGAPAAGSGGAIYNCGQLTIDRTTLIANAAYGGAGSPGSTDSYTRNGYAGGNGASAFGGGICNVSWLMISRSTLCGNIAKGGDGGRGGEAIQFQDLGGSGGNGGNGATGTGGALFNSGGSASLVDCTIAFNNAQGGSGGWGGDGAGAVSGQSGGGGNGGNGENGIGGGVSGGCSFVNCTIAGNSSVAGAAGLGGGGSPGVPIPGSPGSSGSAYGGGEGGPNTLCFSNTPGGNNTFANPKLGPLADNGGPTLTMALLPGSPAIDAGTASGTPATDQRGVPRPQGAGVDIGAFEYLTSPIFMGATFQSTTNCQMQLCGMTPNPTLTLQVSTNLLNWWDATNFTAGSNGVFQCVDPIPGDTKARYYRLKSGTP